MVIISSGKIAIPYITIQNHHHLSEMDRLKKRAEEG